jgi:restriction system protein
MYIAPILFFSFLGLALWAFVLHQRKTLEVNNELSKLNRLITRHEDIRKLLLAGMYQRFAEAPSDYERFVAETIQTWFGGEVTITPTGGDGDIGRIDIVHRLEGRLLLGEVQCFAPNRAVDYVPIALLHSQLVRMGADGGFFVTTSTFTDQAVSYAESVGIELWNGEQFLEMWMETVRERDEDAPVFDMAGSHP